MHVFFFFSDRAEVAHRNVVSFVSCLFSCLVPPPSLPPPHLHLFRYACLTHPFKRIMARPQKPLPQLRPLALPSTRLLDYQRRNEIVQVRLDLPYDAVREDEIYERARWIYGRSEELQRAVTVRFLASPLLVLVLIVRAGRSTCCALSLGSRMWRRWSTSARSRSLAVTNARLVFVPRLFIACLLPPLRTTTVAAREKV